MFVRAVRHAHISRKDFAFWKMNISETLKNKKNTGLTYPESACAGMAWSFCPMNQNLACVFILFLNSGGGISSCADGFSGCMLSIVLRSTLKI
jgi:hypothetical protein